MDNTAVDQALSSDTFDVLAFVEKAAYPVKMVTVFRDPALAKQYAELVQERRELEDEQRKSDQQIQTDELDAKIDEVAEALKANSMTFELRGYPPGIVEEIQKQYITEEDPDAHAGDVHLIAKAIVAVYNSAGGKDSRVWDGEQVAQLKRFLVEGEYLKLLSGVAEVIFNAAVFDQAADAGFSGGRPDVAPEL